MTDNPSSSALALTGEGSNFLPRPRTASGRVMTSTISLPAATSEVSEGTAKSGVPINTIRIKVSLLSITSRDGYKISVPGRKRTQPQEQFNRNKYTQNQRKSRNKSSSSNKAIISEDAPSWPNGTRANQARTTQSPVLSAHISSRAQFRNAARMFEHGMICGRSAPGTVGTTPSRPVERRGPGRPGTP